MAAQTTTPRLFDVDELPDIYDDDSSPQNSAESYSGEETREQLATQSDPPKAPEAPRTPLLIHAKRIELRRPKWLLRRILESGTLALIFGDPGCGKTFLALDWAARIATGTPWRGYPVKPAPVVYLAGESPQRLGRRLLAWQQLNRVSLAGAPLCIGHAVAISEPKEVARLLRAIDSLPEPPALIVLDNLARCFGAGDENSTQDMTRFIAGCDAIRRHCGASVLIVHYSGHGDKTRDCGAMTLKAALDAEYRLEQTGGGNLLLTATKMRDAEVPAPLGLRLEPVELPGMVDNFGNPVTSAAIEVVDADTSAIVAGTILPHLGAW